ncbi:MAG: carbohydrate porin [Planctomycetaceae bacterium]
MPYGSAAVLLIGCLGGLAGPPPACADEWSDVDSDIDQLFSDPALSADDLATRNRLGGDLGGIRSGLAARGATLDLSSTQFYQGVTAGGIQRNFEFSGRADYYLNVDGEQAGLWQGLFVNLHGETRYGDTINPITGELMPANIAGLFPLPYGSVTALTAVKFTQVLSNDLLIYAGKINLIDEIKQQFSGGRGVDAFMNTAIVFPVAADRTVPYSTLGAGFVWKQDHDLAFSMMLLDTHNTPTTSGFETFFTNGATILARVDRTVHWFDRLGHQTVWGTYSSGTYNDLSPTPYLDPITGNVTVPSNRQTGSWALFYAADQALWVDPNNSARAWGLFTNIGLADDGPSPIRFGANVGLGGSSPLTSRPLDTFGIGYAYTRYSAALNQLPASVLPIGNDQVVELFYNYAVTPWFRVTPDLQVLIPARERTLGTPPQPIDTALVLGIRAKLDF